MQMMYEDGSYSAEGKSYEQMVSELKAYARAGDYGCYMSTIDAEYVKKYNDTHEMPIDIDAFLSGETVIVGMDRKDFAPHATLVGKTLNLTSDNADGQSVNFLVGGAFTYDDYVKERAELGRHKHIGVVPDVIYVSEAGMKRLTQTAIIYNIGIDVNDLNQLQTVANELADVNS